MKSAIRSAIPAARAESLRLKRIMLIEDNDSDAMIVARLLDRTLGCLVETHVRLGPALARIGESPPALVLLDLSLPDADGFDGLDALARAAPTVPIVVLTGEMPGEGGEEALRRGAEDFLSKRDLEGGLLARTISYAIERKRQGTLLRKTQESLREIVQANVDAMLVVDESNIIRLANHAATVLLGPKLVGTPLAFDVEPGMTKELQLPSRSTGGGELRTAELRSSRVTWDGLPAVLASIRDVSERRREEQLRAQLLHADRLASIGQLTAGVAHEVNNPAAFVMANLEVMRDHLEVFGAFVLSTSPEAPSDISYRLGDAQAIVSECLEGMRRITSIVRDLKTFARIERDDVEPVSVNEVVSAACSIVHNEIRHRARLVKDFAVVPNTTGDKGKLAQVVTNLLLNAAQAIPAGSSNENVIRIQTRLEQTEIVVSVEDSGCGMSDETRRRALEPFFTTKPREEGTGLGLTLAAEIVRNHGGRLEVGSVEGEGTTVRMRLPVRSTNDAAKPRTSGPPQPQTTARLHILLIDDEEHVLRAMARALGTKYQITTTSSGKSALAHMEASSFDVVCCDLMMPEQDGPAIYEEVGRRWPGRQRRFLFFSGGAFTPRAKQFLASSRVPLLEKPARTSALIEAIEEVYRQAQDAEAIIPSRRGREEPTDRDLIH